MAIVELGKRCEPLSEHIKKFQPWHIRKVAGKVNVVMIAVLVVVMGWPDWALPLRFVTGFSLIGELEKTGIFVGADKDEMMSREELFQHSRKLLQKMRFDPDFEDHEIDFLWSSCQKEQLKGFGGHPMPFYKVEEIYGGKWACVPSFVHTQPCGKMRRIDNAKRGGQNRATRVQEKIHLCSAFQPAVGARLLAQELSKQGEDISLWQIESGCEDLPDAYRGLPCTMEDLCVNLVTIKQPTTKSRFFVQMYALLFGYESAVNQFGRWSKFHEAVGRCILMMMWSMYVDDGNVLDFVKAEKKGQNLINTYFTTIGTPLQEDKRVLMSSECTFLGIVHDMSTFHTEYCISFWPRDRLLLKLKLMLKQFKSSASCPPGDAAKFRGTVQFTAHASSNHVGKFGMGPFKQRQYTDVEPWALTKSMLYSMSFFGAIFQQWPKRRVDLFPLRRRPLVIASDAQADPGRMPTGGFVAIDGESGVIQAGFIVFTQELLDVWGFTREVLDKGGNPIAPCEAAMVPIALKECEDLAQGREVIFFIDNSVALYGMVRGCSNEKSVARCSAVVGFMSHAWKVHPWFEFVDSKSNWSDSISRNLDECAFCAKHSIPIREVHVGVGWWTTPINDVCEAFCY